MVSLVALLLSVLERAPVDVAPPLRDLGEHIVMQPPDQRHVAGQPLIDEELTGRGQVAHVAIEDGDPQWGLLQGGEHARKRRQPRCRPRGVVYAYAFCPPLGHGVPSHLRAEPTPQSERMAPRRTGQY